MGSYKSLAGCHSLCIPMYSTKPENTLLLLIFSSKEVSYVSPISPVISLSFDISLCQMWILITYYYEVFIFLLPCYLYFVVNIFITLVLLLFDRIFAQGIHWLIVQKSGCREAIPDIPLGGPFTPIRRGHAFARTAYIHAAYGGGFGDGLRKSQRTFSALLEVLSSLMFISNDELMILRFRCSNMFF